MGLLVGRDEHPPHAFVRKIVCRSHRGDKDPLALGFRFKDLTDTANVGDSGSGMGVTSGDYDGDGDLLPPERILCGGALQLEAYDAAGIPIMSGGSQVVVATAGAAAVPKNSACRQRMAASMSRWRTTKWYSAK